MRILYAVVFIAFVSCYAPERNCEHFKTGTFEFETYLNGELAKTTFVRNDSIEIEYFQQKVDTSSIRWINECEYILTNLNPENRAEEKPVHIKILTTEKETYTFEFSMVGGTKKQKGTAKKTK
ncbi:DNA topoisomerase IV [Mesonia sp. K7]|uniref:DNA topoisomerase IV n=1 Tax=Mesonia sp. K7 TaxID=2218606 RepID=UPI000DA76870|nr:DNA topoisomerase IV [Mesonia sp. K7]PZD79269.1 DNA topoisomerase IV [Mesonia sp. K7]